MHFVVDAVTDKGAVKDTNQDGLCLMKMSTVAGELAFAVLCDGMGGLEKGELASAEVVRAFERWAYNELPLLCSEGISERNLKAHWRGIVDEQAARIMEYGRTNGCSLGTTVVCLLCTQTHYYAMNVGDSRAYLFTDRTQCITNDHTWVAREVSMGRMSEEDAQTSPQRSVLLQCIGASKTVIPDFYSGKLHPNCTLMLCSDGFRHEVSDGELYNCYRPDVLTDANVINNASRYLISLNMQRGERDNITVIAIKTIE